MTKTKGRAAQPKNGAGTKARPLDVVEVLDLCGGNEALIKQVLNEAKGKKDVSRSILETIVKATSKTMFEDKGITTEEAQQILAKTDENAATRILRVLAKKMVAHQAQQAQPSA